MVGGEPDEISEKLTKAAQKRYDKLLKIGVKKADALCELTRDLSAIVGMLKLRKWCKRKRVKTIFSSTRPSELDPGTRTITVNTRTSVQNQLFYYLHECGHLLVGLRLADERFGMGYTQLDPKVTKSLLHKCDVVDEEFEAWYRGWKLAKKLRIDFDSDKFHSVRTKSIKTYMKWAIS